MLHFSHTHKNPKNTDKKKSGKIPDFTLTWERVCIPSYKSIYVDEAPHHNRHAALWANARL